MPSVLCEIIWNHANERAFYLSQLFYGFTKSSLDTSATTAIPACDFWKQEAKQTMGIRPLHSAHLMSVDQAT